MSWRALLGAVLVRSSRRPGSGRSRAPGSFDEFGGACNALTGVTTEQLPPERQEAKPLCAKAMWPDAVAARSFPQHRPVRRRRLFEAISGIDMYFSRVQLLATSTVSDRCSAFQVHSSSSSAADSAQRRGRIMSASHVIDLPTVTSQQQTVGESLRPVTSIEITVLLDNTVEILLPSTEVVRRPPLLPDAFDRPALRAERGYSALITIDGGPSVLYDAGISKDGAARNLSVLDVAPTDLRAVVLSHGHADHHGGLEGLLPMLGRPRLPLLLHPDAWRQRRFVFPTGAEVGCHRPLRPILLPKVWKSWRAGAEPAARRPPHDHRSDRAQHPVRTGTSRSASAGRWQLGARSMDLDDQAVVVNVRGRGLVVVSGCSHSGAVNVMVAARRQTGVDAICAFVGGMHLVGPVLNRSSCPRWRSCASWRRSSWCRGTAPAFGGRRRWPPHCRMPAWPALWVPPCVSRPR
jgi:7,8-dihydropterin-6-yl-methyl-4-(beta-D-ribofuranosyl)aminobenzene 5'-phosphate synthase